MNARSRAPRCPAARRLQPSLQGSPPGSPILRTSTGLPNLGAPPDGRALGRGFGPGGARTAGRASRVRRAATARRRGGSPRRPPAPARRRRTARGVIGALEHPDQRRDHRERARAGRSTRRRRRAGPRCARSRAEDQPSAAGRRQRAAARPPARTCPTRRACRTGFRTRQEQRHDHADRRPRARAARPSEVAPASSAPPRPRRPRANITLDPRLPAGRLQRVAQQEGDRHRADAAGNRA